jgi:hypothetical protein
VLGATRNRRQRQCTKKKEGARGYHEKAEKERQCGARCAGLPGKARVLWCLLWHFQADFFSMEEAASRRPCSGRAPHARITDTPNGHWAIALAGPDLQRVRITDNQRYKYAR